MIRLTVGIKLPVVATEYALERFLWFLNAGRVCSGTVMFLVEIGAVVFSIVVFSLKGSERGNNSGKGFS